MYSDVLFLMTLPLGYSITLIRLICFLKMEYYTNRKIFDDKTNYTLHNTNLNLIQTDDDTQTSVIETVQVGPTFIEPDDQVVTHTFELGKVKIGKQLTDQQKTQ